MKTRLRTKALSCVLAFTMAFMVCGFTAFADDGNSGDAAASSDTASMTTAAAEATSAAAATDEVATASEAVADTSSEVTAQADEATSDATARTYTVTYMVGTEQFDAQTVEAGSVATRPATDPVAAAGKVFSGWYASADAAAAATDAYDFLTPVNSDMTLVAGFTDETTTQEAAPASAAPSVTTQSDPVLTPAAVGDTFTVTINVGGINLPCDCKVLTENGTTGTVGLGDGNVGGGLVSHNSGGSGVPTIPDTVTYNGVTYTVTTIDPFYFWMCQGFTTTSLEKNTSVTTLLNYSYVECNNITSTGLERNTSVTSIGTGVFEDCDKLVDTGLATNSTVTSLGDGCFGNCDTLADAAIGSGVTTIGTTPFEYERYAWWSSKALKTVCYYGNFIAPSNKMLTSEDVHPVVYYLSENTTWTGKTAADVATDASALKSLSKLNIVNGSTTSTPSNPWTSKAGTATEGRWAEGETANLTAAAAPAGYHFGKWTTTDSTGSFSGAADPNATYTVGKSTGEETATVSSTYAPNTYKIVFDKNATDATGTMADEPMTYDVASNLTANAFSRDGYHFEGWTTAADGSGTSYDDKASVENLTSENGATVTLYARWVADSPASVNTVTYEVSGDVPAGYTVPTDSTTYAVGQSVTVAAVPTADGYTFSGWTLNGTQVTSATMVAGGITLKGVWTKDSTVTPTSTTTGTGTVSSSTDNSPSSSASVMPKTGDALTFVLLGAAGVLVLGIGFFAMRRHDARVK